MSNKIEELTKEQTEKLDEYYEKWLAIGLAARQTTQEDRDIVEDQLKKLYVQEGYAPPKKIYWEKSIKAAMAKCRALGDNEESLASSAAYGFHDANSLGFFDYIAQVLGLTEEIKEADPLIEISKHCGWYWEYEDCVVCSELPTEIHLNSNGDLHNFNGPAIAWSDGEALYFFNGIAVTKQHAMTPADQLTKKDILGEENADIRMQLIQKVGAEKTAELFDATIADTLKTESGGIYELLLIDYLEDGVKRPFLRMTNPSEGTIHVEGVEGGTVAEALCFRNGLVKLVEPMVVT